MENSKQQTADHFWETQFPELLDTQLNDKTASETDFWNRFDTALDMTDLDVVHAVIYSKPIVSIASGDLYIRLVKTAKRVWDKKRN